MDVKCILACSMLVLLMSSAFYLFGTSNMDTPFKNSLSAAQVKLKDEESHKRKCVFFKGIVLSVIILYFWMPFKMYQDANYLIYTP